MKRITTVFIIVLMITAFLDVPAKADSAVFTDIGKSFAKNDIIALYNKRIIDGTGTGLFEPANTVTRAEFVKILAGVFNLEQVLNSIPSFIDVKRSDWFYGWVYAANNLGLVAGKSETSFAPNETITREEAAVILARATKQSPVSDADSFQDELSVSTWALASVKEVIKAGMMKGDGQSFHPQQRLTREEAAAILNRISDKLQMISQTTSPIQLGWQYANNASEFKQQVMKSTINVISPRWFFLEKDGKITVSVDSDLVKWAHTKQKKVWALVGNRFDSDAIHLFLTTQKDTAITQLVNYIQQYELDGLNLDFENVDQDDRNLLTAFVKELGARLHSAKKILSIDVPPDSNSDWSEPYDYAALSKYADYLILMNYEEHWAGSSVMGSVSSLSWFVQGMQQINNEISSGSKLIVGLPLYTRDWRIEAGQVLSKDISLPDQEQLFPAFQTMKWDSAVGQYVAAYAKNNVVHNIWIEDSRSLTLKYIQALNQNAAGFAYWYIGSETEDIWAALRNAYWFSELRYES